MTITNRIGHKINDFEDWEKAFLEFENEKHWKEGRSARELANYFTQPYVHESDGISKLNEYLSKFTDHDVTLSHGEIEHESKFDTFRGKGRMQDLIIWGTENHKSIAICIEAKVDETFGKSIADAYKDAVETLKTTPKSKAKERIENLCSKYYPDRDINSIHDIRYQLLYYLEGSIREANKIGGVAFLPVMVFHTDQYNSMRGENNKKDYKNFLNSLHFELIDKEKEIYRLEKDGVIVYTSYIDIL